MGVDSLGYVALNVSKIGDWSVLLEQVFGMEPRPREGAIDYRLDSYHHRFSLYPSDHDSVAAVGWEVGSTAKLEATVAALRSRQIEVTPGSPELCAERKVKQLYSFTCPMIGNRNELYYGPLTTNTAFAPRRVRKFPGNTIRNPGGARRALAEGLICRVTGALRWGLRHRCWLSPPFAVRPRQTPARPICRRPVR